MQYSLRTVWKKYLWWIGYCEWTDVLCCLVKIFFVVFQHFMSPTIWWIKMIIYCSPNFYIFVCGWFAFYSSNILVNLLSAMCNKRLSLNTFRWKEKFKTRSRTLPWWNAIQHHCNVFLPAVTIIDSYLLTCSDLLTILILTAPNNGELYTWCACN